MSFASPVWLLALLIVPLLVLAARGSQARARKTAIRFPAAGTLAQAGSGPDWGRHGSALLALLAVCALAFALAKPQHTVRVPVEQASIVLVTDHSGSMAATDVDPTRLGAAQRAAQTFIDKLPGEVKVGAVGFSAAPDMVQAPSTDHDASRALIDSQEADGGTATGDALLSALNLLATTPKHPPAAVVLLSDGATTAGSDPIAAAQRARQLKVPGYTVALGSPGATVPNPDPFGPPLSAAPDPDTLREISRVTGGRAFAVDDADRLKSIYEQLGSQLGTRAKEQEISSRFAIGGLVLLLAAGMTSVLVAGRLP
jgi:Ca-activated chloride channel family protein